MNIDDEITKLSKVARGGLEILLQAIVGVEPPIMLELCKKITDLTRNVQVGIEFWYQFSKILRTIARDQLVGIFDLTMPIIEDIGDENAILQIFDSIAAIPPELRVKIVQSAMPLVQAFQSGTARANILYALTDPAIDVQPEEILQLSAYLTDIAYEMERRALLSLFFYLLRKELVGNSSREAFLQTLSRLLEASIVLQDVQDRDIRATLAYSLEGIEPPQIIEALKNFILVLMQVAEKKRAITLASFQEVPLSQRAKVLQSVSSSLGKATRDFDKTYVLHDVATMLNEIGDEEKRGVLLQSALELLSEAEPLLCDFEVTNNFYWPRNELLIHLSTVSVEQVRQVVEQTLPLVKDIDRSDVYSITQIFRAVAEIPPEHRVELIQILKPLIELCSGRPFGAEILDTFSTFDPKLIKRDSLEDLAQLRLLLEENCEFPQETYALVWLFRNILGPYRVSHTQSEALHKAVEKLLEITSFLQDVPMSDMRRELLLAIDDIEPAHMVEVLCALMSLTADLDSENRWSLLTSFGYMEVPLKVEILKKVTLMLQTWEKKCNKTYLLYDVAKMLEGVSQEEEKASIYGKALKRLYEAEPILCNVEPSGYRGRGFYLKILKTLEPDQIRQIVQLTLPLIEDIDYEDEQEDIFLAITEIPSEQRAEVVDCATPLLYEFASGHVRASILLKVRDIDPIQRKDIVAQTLKAFEGLVDVNEKLDIFFENAEGH